MKKALIYIGSFIAAWFIILSAILLFLAVVVMIISFVTWTWPAATLIPWAAIRFLSVLAAISAIFWSFSTENKEFVNSTLKGKK